MGILVRIEDINSSAFESECACLHPQPITVISPRSPAQVAASCQDPLGQSPVFLPRSQLVCFPSDFCVQILSLSSSSGYSYRCLTITLTFRNYVLTASITAGSVWKLILLLRARTAKGIMQNLSLAVANLNGPGNPARRSDAPVRAGPARHPERGLGQ